MKIKEAQEITLKAKPIHIGREIKGFFLEVNDFISLISALNEQEDPNE